MSVVGLLSAIKFQVRFREGISIVTCLYKGYSFACGGSLALSHVVMGKV